MNLYNIKYGGQPIYDINNTGGMSSHVCYKVGHAKVYQPDKRKCEHCFCKVVYPYGLGPHEECCMCKTRRETS